MKKTLMVLSLALCASFAFAQTKQVSLQHNAERSVAASHDNQASYKASIFTKDDEVIRHWEFEAANAGFTTGTFDQNVTIAGTQYSAHAQGTDFSKWQRISGPDAAILQNPSTYPVLGNPDNGYTAQFWYRRMDTTASSSENGFMLMSMQDQIRDWGGSGDRGVFHSYIKFDGVSTAEAGIVDVRFFQYYRKFNGDQCFVDYSFDNGSTWNTQEVNVRGVDVSVNDQLWGNYTYTMPVAVAGKENVIFRIRWYSAQNNGGAYGYFWALDDFKAIAGKASRLRLAPENYVEGAYQIVPQNLELPLSWAMNVINNGTIRQNNVQAKLFNENGGLIGSGVAQNIDADPAVTKFVGVDGLGWLADTNSANQQGWYGYSANWMGLMNGVAPTKRNNGYPTDVEGWHSVYAQLVTDSLERTFDTISYLVNRLDSNGYAIWGVDNGVLTRAQQFNMGFDDDGEYIADEGHWYESGYSVSVRYTTGDTIPEGWVLHGLEIVPATVRGAATAGRVISAQVNQDYFVEGGQVYFLTVNTGANPYTVQESDLNDSASIAAAGNYMEFGDYNTVRIMFPEQPELEPYTSYRLGYVLETAGFFSAASANAGYYVVPTVAGDRDSAVYFSNDPATEKYSKSFAGANLGTSIKNGYDMYLNDRSSLWAGFYADAAPAIRAIVGPSKEVERVAVNAVCQKDEDDNYMGVVTWFGDTLCDDAAMVAKNSTPTFYIRPATNYQIDSVFVDGVYMEPYDEDEETGDENLRVVENIEDHEDGGYTHFADYMVLTMPNVAEEHTIRVVYSWYEVGVDPVASNVFVSLQPNPASSQVRLNIAGVEGMVNCSIIDMSGRVVYNQNINAESAQVINLSNMAKGAYFVRIVNDKFSKVEKLIVR